MSVTNSKKRILIIVIGIACGLALILSAVLILSKCNISGENDNSSVPQESTDTSALDDEPAPLKWVPGTAVEFELGVKPDIEYSLTPQDHDKCTFVDKNGAEIHLEIQGLDYETAFDQLVTFFKLQKPQSLLVGKQSKTVIVRYNDNETEIVSKLTEEECLTAKGQNQKTIEDFYSTVMIKVFGKDYTPIDSEDEFEEIQMNEISEPVAPTCVLVIEVGEKVFYANLEDNSSAKALVEKLNSGPITVDMHDYGNFEKVGELPWELPRNDEDITTVPGDIILYLGKRIVIYYDENTWDFTRLAKIDNTTKEELLAALGDGNVSVSFSLEWGE